MSRIKGKNTKPEVHVRRLLHRLGYRFTINGPKNRSLPGKPDIVLPRYQTAIFVHGCFWHRHPHCKSATTPKSNRTYWQNKFQRNKQRDREAQASLSQLGWQVIIIWECELKRPAEVAAHLVSQLPRANIYASSESREEAQLVAETQSEYPAKVL